MKSSVVIIMIAALTSFAVHKANSQTDELKPKKTPEERAEILSGKMTKALELTSEQQSNAYSILLEHFTKADEIRASTPDKQSRRPQIKSLRESTDSKITDMLTGSQVIKYNELKVKIKEKKKQNRNKIKE